MLLVGKALAIGVVLGSGFVTGVVQAACTDMNEQIRHCSIDQYRVITQISLHEALNGEDDHFSGERIDLYTRENGNPRRIATVRFVDPHVESDALTPIRHDPGEDEYALQLKRGVYGSLLRQLRATVRPELIVTRTEDTNEIGFTRIRSEAQNTRRQEPDDAGGDAAQQ